MEINIRENLPELCKTTTVDEELLVGMRKIITDNTKNTIQSKPTPFERASAFYTCMCKRPEKDFLILIKALRTSGNDRAADILEANNLTNPDTATSMSKLMYTTVAVPHGSGYTGSVQKFGPDNLQNGQLPSQYSSSGNRAALIINVLKDRGGAELDQQRLKDLLTFYHFHVKICDDLSKEGIKTAVVNFKDALKGHKLNGGKIGAILVAVMSHDAGSDLSLPDDGQLPSSYSNIIDEFSNRNCNALEGIPKIFLVNVSRGDRSETDYEYQPPKPEGPRGTSPNWSDMLICYASYDNRVAYKEGNTATWFIQIFCEVIKANDGMDIENILELVSSKLMEKTGGSNTICQTKNIGFVKKFCFKLNSF